mmetsp:Transcript_8902/g.23096  ORF Transcript_8902/g.23096 Transcript_8902/m.23096 type:complete len:297 (-) Transcript_8902:290-1180(-)
MTTSGTKRWKRRPPRWPTTPSKLPPPAGRAAGPAGGGGGECAQAAPMWQHPATPQTRAAQLRRRQQWLGPRQGPLRRCWSSRLAVPGATARSARTRRAVTMRRMRTFNSFPCSGRRARTVRWWPSTVATWSPRPCGSRGMGTSMTPWPPPSRPLRRRTSASRSARSWSGANSRRCWLALLASGSACLRRRRSRVMTPCPVRPRGLAMTACSHGPSCALRGSTSHRLHDAPQMPCSRLRSTGKLQDPEALRHQLLPQQGCRHPHRCLPEGGKSCGQAMLLLRLQRSTGSMAPAVTGV